MGLRKSEELNLCGMVTHSYMRVQVNNTHLLYPCCDVRKDRKIQKYTIGRLGERYCVVRSNSRLVQDISKVAM